MLYQSFGYFININLCTSWKNIRTVLTTCFSLPAMIRYHQPSGRGLIIQEKPIPSAILVFGLSRQDTKRTTEGGQCLQKYCCQVQRNYHWTLSFLHSHIALSILFRALLCLRIRCCLQRTLSSPRGPLLFGGTLVPWIRIWLTWQIHRN